MLQSKTILLKFSGGELHGRQFVADPEQPTSPRLGFQEFQEVQKYYSQCNQGRLNKVITLIPDYPTQMNWNFETLAQLAPHSRYQVTDCTRTRTSVTVHFNYLGQTPQAIGPRSQPLFSVAAKLTLTLITLWLVERWGLSWSQWLD